MMKKIALILVVSWMTAGVAYAGDFSITSPQVKSDRMIANAQVFNGFGCQGDNISPALQWQGAPEGTMSYAVTVYDPDAPTGSGWWHWVIFNIPVGVTMLETGAGDPQSGEAPAGSVQSMTDFGKPGYGGPCPPAGDKPHHYQFSVYALKVKNLPLDKNASGAMVGFYIHQNLLGKAVLTATYGR
jgi:Raf kinase inhibitor-like YbhB/YbcL family protein